MLSTLSQKKKVPPNGGMKQVSVTHYQNLLNAKKATET